MAQQNINFGTPPKGVDGDTTHTALVKVQANFTELYSVTLSNTGGVVGNQSTGWAAINAPTLRVVDVFSGTNGGLALESYQPLIQFIDRTANSQNTRLRQNAGSLSIENDTAGEGVWKAAGIGLHGDGYMSIGGTPSNNAQMYLRGTTVGTGTSQWGAYVNTEFNEACTGNGYGVSAVIKVKDAPFTMGNLYGVVAGTPTIGAQATVTTYDALAAFDAALSGTPVRVAGLRLRMTTGTNKWNIYSDGTAPSYHNGQLRLGTATDDGSGARLQVLGGATADTPAIGDRSRRLATTEFLGALSFRNRLINGDVLVAQRGTSFTTSGQTLDRWMYQIDQDGGTYSGGVYLAYAGYDNQRNWMRVNHQVNTPLGPNGGVNLRQKVEGVWQLAGGKATFSFMGDSSVTGTIHAGLYQDFGSGGSPSATVFLASQPVTMTPGRKLYKLTFDVPSIAGKTLGTSGTDSLVVWLYFAAGANVASLFNINGKVAFSAPAGSYYFGNLQLEAGAVATEFEQIPYADTLRRCYRYFRRIPIIKWWGYNASGQADGQTYHFDAMRVAPSVSIGSAAYSNNGGVIVESVTNASLSIYAGVLSTGNSVVNLGAVDLNAEL